jgi:hypothetical protein
MPSVSKLHAKPVSAQTPVTRHRVLGQCCYHCSNFVRVAQKSFWPHWPLVLPGLHSRPRLRVGIGTRNAGKDTHLVAVATVVAILRQTQSKSRWAFAITPSVFGHAEFCRKRAPSVATSNKPDVGRLLFARASKAIMRVHPNPVIHLRTKGVTRLASRAACMRI